MSRIKGNLRVLLLVAGLISFAGSGESVRAQHEHHSPTGQQESVEKKEQTDTPKKDSMPDALPAVGLAELEQLALANNPTLKQAQLAVRAAAGRKTQAGLFPNPVVGFSADDISFRNSGDGGKIGFFVEQTVPLGGKLSKSRRLFAQDVILAENLEQAQRARVLNSVRLLYAEALGAQAELELRRELANLSEESVSVSAELYNVGLADRPDQLKSEMRRERAETEYFTAQNKYEETWAKLGAMIGKPEMPPARLAGNWTDFQSAIDAEELLLNLLGESPQIKAAQVKVDRARLALERARADKVPDLYLRGGVRYNNELVEKAGGYRRAGAEGFLEAGVTLPIFNRNQGGIETAEAGLAIAEREVERVRLALRVRFAGVLKNYRSAVFRAERYRTAIVPQARAAFEMYAANFQSMTAAYTNVLSARADYLQAQIEYANKLTEARQALILLKGFLLSGGLSSPVENDSDKNEIIAGAVENSVNEEDEDQK